MKRTKSVTRSDERKIADDCPSTARNTDPKDYITTTLEYCCSFYCCVEDIERALGTDRPSSDTYMLALEVLSSGIRYRSGTTEHGESQIHARCKDERRGDERASEMHKRKRAAFKARTLGAYKTSHRAPRDDSEGSDRSVAPSPSGALIAEVEAAPLAVNWVT